MEAERARAHERRDAPQPGAAARGAPARSAALERVALIRLGPSLAALAVATLSWAIVATLFLDVLGAGRTEPVAAAGGPSDDPCALREPLPVGSDNVCAFALARPGGRPLTVDLDQRWNGNSLSQWLNVRPGGSSESLHFVYAQTTGSAVARVLRVFAIRLPAGDEHLGYLIGRCGAMACPLSDLVVVGDDGGEMRTLLSLRLGPLADVRLAESGLTTVEGWFPPGATTAGGLVARRFSWNGKRYSQRDLTMLPVPAVPPVPAPR